VTTAADGWDFVGFNPPAAPRSPEAAAWTSFVPRDRPGLTVTLRFDATGTCDQVVVSGTTLSRRALAAIPLPDLESEGRAKIAYWLAEYNKTRPPAVVEAGTEILRNAPTWGQWFLGDIPQIARLNASFADRKPGRPRRPLVEFARLAEIYEREIVVGKRSFADVGTELGMTGRRLQDLITEARNEHKLLTQTTGGRRGGHLTPKALALLAFAPDAERFQTAWELATPEQRAAAIERDKPFVELRHALDAREITPEQFGQQLEALIASTFQEGNDDEASD
jgi:hypothetical protein